MVHSCLAALFLSTHPWFPPLSTWRLFCCSCNIVLGYRKFNEEVEVTDKPKHFYSWNPLSLQNPPGHPIWGLSASPSHLSSNQPLNMAQGSALWGPIMQNYSLSLLFLRVGSKKVLFLINSAPKHFIYALSLPILLRIQVFENQKLEGDNPSTPVSIVKPLP